MKSIIYLILMILASCDFAEDPISKIFRLTKNLTAINEKIPVDPTISNKDFFIYPLLYQSLGEISLISTDDSLKWSIMLKETYFSLPSKDLVETEDIYFSYVRNSSRIDLQTKGKFKSIFKGFEKIDDKSMIFEFSEKFDFWALSSSSAFYVYSKYNTTFEIPIGTGTHNIFLRPQEEQYVIMPFIQFIHLQSDSIETLYWVNSNRSEILSHSYNFTLPDPTKIKDLTDYETR